MKRSVLVAAAATVLVLLVWWRLWTPIPGARLVFAGGVAAGEGVALLVGWTLAVFAWLLAREVPPAAAVLGAAVCLVACPVTGEALATLIFIVCALGAVELASRAPALYPAGGLLGLVAAAGPAAAALVSRGPPTSAFGLLVARLPEATLYAGVIPVVAAAVGLALRPTARGLVLAAVTVLGLLASPAVALLGLAALGADGVAAVAGEPRAARRLGVFALVAVAAVGAAAAATTRSVAPDPGSPAHEALVAALFAWATSTWALHALGAAETRWRRLLLIVVAVVAFSDAWHGNLRRIEAGLRRPPPPQVVR